MEMPQIKETVLAHLPPSPRVWKWILIILLGIVLIIVGWFGYRYYKKQQQRILPPIEALGELKEISNPVTQKPEERAQTLQILSSQSKPLQESQASRMARLKMLKQ